MPNTSDAPADAPPSGDPSYDLVAPRRQPLDAIFNPDSVAVIGASEEPGSVGRTLLWNLVSNPFGGTIFPINPKRESVLGIEAYSSIDEVDDDVDLAVIATPAATVPGLVEECGEAGVDGLIIVSAGFREVGEEGAELEREVRARAEKYDIRIVAPNCLGVMRPPNGLNATFAGSMVQEGNVAFVSQSGALLTSILDWSFRENVGFSAFVSIGSMPDVDWGDMITYLGDDPKTESIVLYMESISNARSFLSAARDVAQSKPIIVIRAGRTDAAAEAAASHTGTLTGSDAVLNAAFRRSGVLRVDDINDLFYMAEVLGKQPRPEGPRLTILTNAGGPGVLATDALIDGGGGLTPLSSDALDDFDKILPGAWSHSNPVDILGDADPERYAETLEVAAADGFDGVTVQPMIDRSDGYELIIGSSMDAQFGPVLLFGSGGQLVEVYEDRALGLPPLNTTLARRMMEQTKIYEALKGVRGRTPVDLAALETLLVRFSQLVVEAAAGEGDRRESAAGAAGGRWTPSPRCTCRAPSLREGRGRPSDAGHSSVSAAVRGGAHHAERGGGDDSAYSSRGRAEAGDPPQAVVGAERLPALRQPHAAGAARGPRAPGPYLLHRLRPRDDPGGRADDGGRREGNYWSRPPHPAAGRPGG